MLALTLRPDRRRPPQSEPAVSITPTDASPPQRFPPNASQPRLAAPRSPEPEESFTQASSNTPDLDALRNQLSTVLAHLRSQPSKPNESSPLNPDWVKLAENLALAAMSGQAAALDDLALWVKTVVELRTSDHDYGLAEVAAGFQFLGRKAGDGHTEGIETLNQALSNPHLSGFAAQGLGQAASLGNESALEMLLNYQDHRLLKSDAVDALTASASSGNSQAIEFLAHVASDPEAQPLWNLTLQGLGPAAEDGEPVALDAVAALAKSNQEALRKQALDALETARKRGSAQAAELLEELARTSPPRPQ